MVQSKDVKDRRQISLPVISELKRINKLLFSLKSQENRSFFDDFDGNVSVRLNSL